MVGDAFPSGDWANFRPGPMAGVTRMDAQFRRHAFERHSHATYSIALTRRGVQAFHCNGSLHASRPGNIIVFNPDQAHDGRPGAPEGFGYSMLYVAADALADCLDPGAGITLPRHFRTPLVEDAAIARTLAAAFDAAGRRGEALRAEVRMREAIAQLLLRHGEPGPRASGARAAGERRMACVRELLHERFADDLTVQDLAAAAGLSRAHLTRAFAQHFGVPPHVYLNALRVDAAQRRLLAGEPLAQVALDCGFADQSHFSRRFKGAVGVGPGAWVRQMAPAAPAA